jgi:3-phosphoshikimate 1-carboxyvinyltransferase
VAKTFPDYFEALFPCATAGAADSGDLHRRPTGSGKGTMAAEVAERLGYHLLDSGALYRITGLAARAPAWRWTPPTPSHCGADAAQQLASPDQRVLVGDDVSLAIRTEEAGMNASRVSACPPCAPRWWCSTLSALPGLVADGRDMGTVIFPTRR